MRRFVKVTAVVALFILLQLPTGESRNVEFPGWTSNTNDTHDTHDAHDTHDTIRCVLVNNFDEKRFRISLDEGKTDRKLSEPLHGAVLPHHQMASKQIAELFYLLKNTLGNQPPKTIMLIGPDHKRLGKKQISTEKNPFSTSAGVLEINEKAVDTLLMNHAVGDAAEVFGIEYSVTSLTPYIKYFFPETKIIPLLLQGNLDMASCKDLSDRLAEICSSEDVLVMASIDFSHYLEVNETRKKDDLTWEAIISRDYKRISAMGNDQLDAPPCLNVFLMIMDQMNATKTALVKHSDSSETSGKIYESNTGYFTFVCYR